MKNSIGIIEGINFVDEKVEEMVENFRRINGYHTTEAKKYIADSGKMELCDASKAELAFRAASLVSGVVSVATEIPKGFGELISYGNSMYLPLTHFMRIPFLRTMKLSEAPKDTDLAYLVRISNDHMHPMALAYLVSEYFCIDVTLLSVPSKAGTKFYLWIDSRFKSASLTTYPANRREINAPQDLLAVEFENLRPQSTPVRFKNNRSSSGKTTWAPRQRGGGKS